MGLLKRIENGETTVRDVEEVKYRGVALFMTGLGVGLVIITVVFYIFGN